MRAVSHGDDRAVWPRLAETNVGALWLSFRSAPGVEVSDTAHFLRVRTPVPHPAINPIICRHLPASDDLDALIDETLAYYRQYDSPCLWLITPHTTPLDVRDILVARGLETGRVLPMMAIALNALPETSSDLQGCDIVEVRDEAGFALWKEIMPPAYGLPPSVASPFIALLASAPFGPDASFRHYLALVNGEPVATATLFLSDETAGIYNVATQPKVRGQGIGTAITLAALRGGQERGARVGVLQSSATAYSLYRRMGFADICVWDAYRPSAPTR